ncbi:MAG: hypothetical protein ACFFER_11345 [Candidatus Thorarchaeota archaeon]
MRRQLGDRMFGLKRIGKYLTDSELRQAYSEFKESENTAFRLILNAILSEGWLVPLSRPLLAAELGRELGYTNLGLLKELLSLLVSRGVVNEENGHYSIGQVRTEPIRPEDVGTLMTNFYYDCATFLPDALRGKTVPLAEVPRVVLESVFSSKLTEIGRGVLLRSFSPKKTQEVGVAAFADVGLPFAIRQVNEILNPDSIHVFISDFRWLPSFASVLRLLSEEDFTDKVQPHLYGLDLDMNLDLFYGEEFFAWMPDNLDGNIERISAMVKPGSRVITNDPTYIQEEPHSSAAYILMKTIDGYPQPLERAKLSNVFEQHALRVQTIGDNWVIAEKEASIK